MIKFSHTETYGWEASLRGMRNPMESWEKSDSFHCNEITCVNCSPEIQCPTKDATGFAIGENDLTLMKKLAKAGSDHCKYMRQIFVSVDITAPLYWWKEFDTYKVGTVANSCSTMHTIHKKEFELDDFSHEHLIKPIVLAVMEPLITCLNAQRQYFLESKDKTHWYQMIQLLPSSYNQKRTITLNYEVLRNMYHARKNHKLDEWHTFCDWIESLPYSEIITGKDE